MDPDSPGVVAGEAVCTTWKPADPLTLALQIQKLRAGSQTRVFLKPSSDRMLSEVRELVLETPEAGTTG